MRENEMVDISIILVNYKNVGLTEKCIVSLLNSKTEASFEIIVVDNDSGDDSAEILRDKFPHIVIKDSGKNGGFAYGNNVGVRMARGKYLLLLNNDTVVTDGMLDALYRYAEKNPDVGMLGCRALDRNGMELPIAHQYESLKRIMLQSYVKPVLEKMGLQRRLVKAVEHKKEGEKAFTPAQWIAGSAMFIRRDLYYQVNGLDENFFMYMEDEDLCHRVNDMGYSVGVIPYIGYVHYCGGSTIQSYFLTKEYVKSRLIFFMRYESDKFTEIQKQLYRQIAVVNPDISEAETEIMKRELDEFVRNKLSVAAKNVIGVKQ